jgi:ribosomal protein L11 methyltransferase
VDDFSPNAIEERADAIRVFFTNARARDAAHARLIPRFDVAAVDVSDEDWARRSQQDLQPVTVGRITILPGTNHASHPDPNPTGPKSPIPNHISIVIQPSMGFGTGHHATTRLCLEALQSIDLAGKTLVDAGTGSGILAIAAARLGAARADGVDDDVDAIQAARENLDLNPAPGVSFEVGDLRETPRGSADVVTANLTGALLIKAAAGLLAATRPGGCLILSGLQPGERDAVVSAFGGFRVAWEREDDGWVGLLLEKTGNSQPAHD